MNLALTLPALTSLSAIIVWRMIRIGVLDHPGDRSSHSRPTPKGGGVGIVAATLASILLLRLLQRADTGLIALGLAGLVIAAISWADDLRDFPFSVKLGAQCAAALLAAAGGVLVTTPVLPLLGAMPLGPFAWPITVLWLVVATNAVNFMDGLNGLAAGVVGLASLAVAWFADRHGAASASFVCLSLSAGITGFLPFNYPRARIFMGDVGSQFCGFMLAGVGLAATQGKPGAGVLLVPALLAGLLFDVAFTLARRTIAGARLTQAHRSHLYQVAHRSGVPAWSITLVEWGFVGAGALAASLLRQASLAALCLAAPQLAWLAFVARRAAVRRLVRW